MLRPVVGARNPLRGHTGPGERTEAAGRAGHPRKFGPAGGPSVLGREDNRAGIGSLRADAAVHKVVGGQVP